MGRSLVLRTETEKSVQRPWRTWKKKKTVERSTERPFESSNTRQAYYVGDLNSVAAGT